MKTTVRNHRVRSGLGVMAGVLLLLCVTGLQAGEISPELAGQLEHMAPWEKVKVIVFMEEQAQVEAFVSAEQTAAERRETVVEVLQATAEHTQGPLLEELQWQRDVEILHTYWIINGFALSAPRSVISEIAARPDVASVVKDGVVTLPPVTLSEFECGFSEKKEERRNQMPGDWGVRRIHAPWVWPYYQGEGVAVAVIDTGVNEHPDLKGRVIDGKNYVDPEKPPRDNHGHGTHVSGTIAGNGSQGLHTGVAPKATIISIKVLNSAGSGSWSDTYKAIEESVERKANVINMSLGGFPDQATRDRLRLACKNAISAGINAIVAPAGQKGKQGVTTPGDIPEVITVGATDRGDNMRPFSGRGPVKWGDESFVKPDVSAPGADICSSKHDSYGYHKMSGTSMASPHVAGLVALMLNANSTLDNARAKRILERTAKDLGPKGKDNEYGSGRIIAPRAVIASHFYD